MLLLHIYIYIFDLCTVSVIECSFFFYFFLAEFVFFERIFKIELNFIYILDVSANTHTHTFFSSGNKKERINFEITSFWADDREREKGEERVVSFCFFFLVYMCQSDQRGAGLLQGSTRSCGHSERSSVSILSSPQFQTSRSIYIYLSFLVDLFLGPFLFVFFLLSLVRYSDFPTTPTHHIAYSLIDLYLDKLKKCDRFYQADKFKAQSYPSFSLRRNKSIEV